jgi:hypothetical protein
MVSRMSAARFGVQRGQDLNLEVLVELLEDVGEPLVVQGLRELRPALGDRSWMTSARSAALRSLVRLQQAGRALLLSHAVEPGDLVGVDQDRLPRRRPSRGRLRTLAWWTPLRQKTLTTTPVAVALLLHGDVLDGARRRSPPGS